MIIIYLLGNTELFIHGLRPWNAEIRMARVTFIAIEGIKHTVKTLSYKTWT